MLREYRTEQGFPPVSHKDKEGKLITGFYAGRTHDIIANTDCVLGVEENKEILLILSFPHKVYTSSPIITLVLAVLIFTDTLVIPDIFTNASPGYRGCKGKCGI